MRRTLVTSLLLALAPLAHAQVMAQGTITLIDSTTSSAGTFDVQVSGAGGYVCNGNPITISASNFPDADSFKRFFALATTAFLTGVTVQFYPSAISASCPYIIDIRLLQN